MATVAPHPETDRQAKPHGPGSSRKPHTMGVLTLKLHLDRFLSHRIVSTALYKTTVLLLPAS